LTSRPSSNGPADSASGIADLGFARADLRRAALKGFPEVIYGEGKSAAQILAIARALQTHDGRLLITRLEPRLFVQVRRGLPKLKYHALARCAFIAASRPPLGLSLRAGKGGRVEPHFEGPATVADVLVLAAGTVDLPYAEEAALTAALLGCQVQRLYDVGVAGLHRLLGHVSRLRSAKCLIVAAGMDAALASVVTGLTSRPVIGLPTPVGYGRGGRGEAALDAMLQACAPGLTVVNIGNGFGAGYAAAQIALPPSA
jgi:pyridinium-3,5-biscarboxylic acid mononucleotide synthase